MNFVRKIKNKNQISIINENNENISAKLLFKIIEHNSDIIRKLKIKKIDTIAIVIENSPAFITSFLSTINVCIAAPLNPSYTSSEFAFYFKDLKPKALITNLKSTHPSIKIAYKNKVKILRINNLLFTTKEKLLKK